MPFVKMRRSFSILSITSVWILLFGSSARAEPNLTGASPGAVRPGEPVDLTITGSDLAGATGLWTSFPADVSLSPDVKDNGTKADQVVFRVKATDPDILGVHGIRVLTPRGMSPLRLLVVDDLPSVAQQNTNKSPDAAQPISLPIAVDGRVDNLSLNYYRFTAEAGQRVSIEVLARRIGSALDPVIRLFQADGRELAYNDDAPGLLGDARLCHTFAEAGDYLIEVRDIRYQGGGNHIYRLRVGDFPCVNVPYPLGVQRGQEATLEFAGPDLADLEPLTISAPEFRDMHWFTVGAKRVGGQTSGFATFSLGDAEEFLETEPNNTAEQANKTSLTAHFNGRLQERDDVDRFTFAAKKGAKHTFTAITRQQGSPADLVLKLYDAQAKKIAEADDSGTEDAVLNATFPADGEFTLTVEDLHGRGGSEFAYRIEVTETRAGFSLVAAADGVNLPRSGASIIPLAVNRTGYNGPIKIRAEGLPGGTTFCPTVVGPGQKGINLCFEATASAKPGSFRTVKIIGEADINGYDHVAEASLDLALKAKTNQMPYPPKPLLGAMALAVAPKAPFSLRVEPTQVTFGKDLSAKFKVIADRQKDYTEAITIAVPNINDGGPKPVPGLPPNVTAALKPIPQGQNEVEITLTANNKAPEGQFTVVLDGALKKGKSTIKQPASSLSVKLEKPFSLEVEPKTISLKAEGKQKIKVSVERNPALAAEIALNFKNLPAGVTALAAKIPADQSSIEIELTAAKDAKPVSANNVVVEGKAAVDKKNFAGASPPVTVAIQ